MTFEHKRSALKPWLSAVGLTETPSAFPPFWRKFTYEEIIARDKTNLDIFWIRDESVTDLDNLPDPDVLAEEIIENLEAGVESFKQIMESINGQ